VIGAVRALAAMLLAATSTGVCVRAVAPTRPEGRAVLRSAVTFAWATIALPFAVAVARGGPVAASVPPLDAVMTVTLAYGAAALVALRVCRGRAGWAAGALGASLLVLAFEAAATGAPSFAETLSAMARAAFALALCSAMKRRRHAGLRALAHALVLSSTIAVLLPSAILAEEGHASSWPAPSAGRVGFAALLALTAFALGAAATAAFVRAGGTPDPLDPPVRLVTGGPYARLRHPLQIAESMLVAASALVTGDTWVVAYAAGCVFFLVGPMRILEQALLEERYGLLAARYNATVPAFLIRVPAGEVYSSRR
jgi:protein-S-isoprenylcysteine O-methyltransferase Ste14